ncbi:MAG: tRNA (guanosine(37)-N1)-methyltransferase TrmD [Synergistaceae bacterium]|jgi:tRNA (guanine37-N1)-methyltransferase|nr:tRNA (guanosine(37)-N1)-methyltransferase TrmD [Synergistaceae bacterium]
MGLSEGVARISVITAFPGPVRDFLGASVLGRGIASGKLEVSVVDIRDHAAGAYRQIDDYSFGGGGMVLMPGPLESALESVAGRGERCVAYPTPQGVPLHQEMVEDLYRVSLTKRLAIVCGHYEGVDERFVKRNVDVEFSIGDFVLTGGELPAIALVDAISRLVKGVVGKERAVEEDSFFSGMLDHPHYTRPSDFEGQTVPEALLGGDHAAIESFRKGEAVRRTISRRPDIIAKAGIMPFLRKGAYVLLLHHPVLDKNGGKSTTAITGMDVHDISRACRTYGIKKYFVVTPLAPQREMVKKIASHWLTGYGAEFNPDRKEAMGLVKTSPSLGSALDWIEEREKASPFTIATTARHRDGGSHWSGVKRQLLEISRPAVFIFGTGSGLHDEVLSRSSVVMRPISGGNRDYNHLSVRNAVSIVLDRFFGFR